MPRKVEERRIRAHEPFFDMDQMRSACALRPRGCSYHAQIVVRYFVLYIAYSCHVCLS